MKNEHNFDDLAPRFARNIYSSMKGEIRLAVLKRDFQEFLPEAFSQEQEALGQKQEALSERREALSERREALSKKEKALCQRGEALSVKGKALSEEREAISDKQAAPSTEQAPLNVLDIGAGQGQFSLQLAKSGCSVVLNDVSQKMLAYAETARDQLVAKAELAPEQVSLICCPAQELENHLGVESFDLVLCHALIEWVEKPEEVLKSALERLKPGGWFSLIFYNYEALAFKNLLRTNFHKFDYDNFVAFKGSLTPAYPQKIESVEKIISELGLEIKCKSGIRTFYDYILDPEMRTRDKAGVLSKELEYSRRSPFRELARYIHFFCRKNDNGKNNF